MKRFDHFGSDWEEVFAKWAIFSFFQCFSIFNGHFLSIYTDFNEPFSKLMGLWRMAPSRPCLPNHCFEFFFTVAIHEHLHDEVWKFQVSQIGNFFPSFGKYILYILSTNKSCEKTTLSTNKSCEKTPQCKNKACEKTPLSTNESCEKQPYPQTNHVKRHFYAQTNHVKRKLNAQSNHVKRQPYVQTNHVKRFGLVWFYWGFTSL